MRMRKTTNKRWATATSNFLILLNRADDTKHVTGLTIGAFGTASTLKQALVNFHERLEAMAAMGVIKVTPITVTPPQKHQEAYDLVVNASIPEAERAPFPLEDSELTVIGTGYATVDVMIFDYEKNEDGSYTVEQNQVHTKNFQMEYNLL